MPLDIATMLWMITAHSVVMALALAIVGWGQRRDGVAWWGAGLLLHALAYALYLQRGRIHDAWSIGLANVLLASTFVALLAAINQFTKRPVRSLEMALPVLAMALATSIWIDNYVARATTTSLCLALQIGLLLRALQWPAQPIGGRGVRLLRLALWGEMLALLGRVASGLWGLMHPSGLMHNDSGQALTFLFVFITVLLASLGFVVMTKDRLDASNRRLATTDALTGVANRRSIIFALDRDAARAKRVGEPLAVMVLDIDHFKRVNDEHGHLGGDQVLRHVVNVLCDRVRAQDMVGRYGGEEFLILLPDTDLAGALVLAEQLRQSVQDSVCHWQGQALSVTISIGVFAGLLEPHDRWDMLIDAADRAMYRAKQNGRNRVEAETQLRIPVVAPQAIDDPQTFPMSLQ